jgi:hypothetical protein
MDLEPGDIQLLSNHTVLHARTAYVDHEQADRKRHLLRLWLSVESPRSLRERVLKIAALGSLIATLLERRLHRRMNGPANRAS